MNHESRIVRDAARRGAVPRAGALGAPRYPGDYRIPRGILPIGLAVAIVLPLTGLAIVAFAAIDFLLPKRLKQAAMA